MTAPLRVFFGQGAGNQVFLGFDGASDDGDVFSLYAQSADWAPGGSSGEVLFPGIYLGVSWSVDVTLRVTPILDGVAYDGTGGTTDERYTLTLVGTGVRQSQSCLIPCTVPLLDPIDDTIERARFSMRGRSFAVRIETVGALADGDVIIEDVEVEHLIVSDSKQPAGSHA